MYLGKNYFFPRSLSNVFLSLFLWVVEVPDADPLGFQGSGLLPTLVSCQDMEMGWGWSTACPALFPDGCCGRSPSLSLSLSTFSLILFNSSTVFFLFNHIMLLIKHYHTCMRSCKLSSSADSRSIWKVLWEWHHTRTPHSTRWSCLFYANKRCLIVFNSTSTSEFHSDKATVKSECGLRYFSTWSDF